MFAVIYIPDFHLQAALRLEPELHSRPVALIDEQIAKAAVFQLTAAARASGVTEGLTSVQAMARCREVIIRPRSRAQEQAATESLLQCAYCFSPAIEATADGVCTMDLKGLPMASPAGMPALPGAADSIWAEKILNALDLLHLRAQVGIAETPNIALQAARFAPYWERRHPGGEAQAQPFLAIDNAEEFISALPIGCLDPPTEMLEILEKWGIRSTGAFLALGKDTIAERLGPEALELFDLASTRETRPLKLVVPAETFEESVEFENPIELLEPLLFSLRRFIDQLCRRLEAVYLVAEEVKLGLGLSSGEKHERAFHIPAPTRDVETLFRMLHTHLENVRTDSPVNLLRLSVKPCKAQNYQFGLFEVALRDPNHFHQTLARLTALLGSDRVGSPQVEETHRPDAFQMAPPHFEAPAELELPPDSKDAISLPLRRFRPPLPALVEVRENRPALLRSAPFTGPITQANGPWRISGNWWDNQKWARDEWDVQTRDGSLYRLAHQDETWFVEGVYD